MQSLPRDIHNLIFLNLNIRQILCLCQTCKYYQTICQSRIFWQLKLQHDLDIPDLIIFPTNERPIDIYIEYLTEGGGVEIGSENYISINEALKRAIDKNDIDLVKYFLTKKLSPEELQLLLTDAMTSNNRDIVLLLLNKIPNNIKYNMNIKPALINGNFEMIQLFTERGGSTEDAIKYSIDNNNIELLKYLLLKNINKLYVPLLKRALSGAIANNSERAIELILEASKSLDKNKRRAWKQELNYWISKLNSEGKIKLASYLQDKVKQYL